LKIKNIKINNYGNLENKEINLENKINIIYGKNESGKSTLLNYIKNIFYGISKNKNGKEISDYEKYKPWKKDNFSGKIKYELDDGNNFEIFRDFNKKNPKVFNGNLEEISKEFNIDKKDGLQVIYEQTKVDEAMFLSTVVSMQQEVKLDKQSQQVLVQRIANLAGTGDDSISFKKVIDKLNKKQVDEIGTERTQEKPINIVKNRMKEIGFVLKELNLYKENKKELENKKNNIEEKILNLEIKYNIAKKLNELNLENNLEKEKINLKNKIKNQIQEKINELNLEKNKLIENKKINNKNEKIKQKNKKINYLILFFTIILLFIELINIIYIKNFYLGISSLCIFSIIMIYLIIKNKLNKKIKKEKIKNENNIIQIKIDNIDTQIKQFNNELNEQTEQIKNSEIQMDSKIDLEIQKIKKEYNNKIKIKEILDELEFNNIQKQTSYIQDELNKNKLDLQSIILEEKNILPKLENIISLKEELKKLEEELINLEEKNNNILLTKEYLNKAYEKMKSNITPKFTESLSNSIAEISNKKYTKITINDEKGLIVENELGEYICIDRLSVGTIDQLYLALRLCMIDDISEEKMPIILDEAFAYYDDYRLENILNFLIERAKTNQIIIFTCTKREIQMLDKLKVNYNLVEL